MIEGADTRQKYIKDIILTDNNFRLMFEVVKRIADGEDGLLCQVSDQTGTAKFHFRNEIKKYILEGKVYVGSNVMVTLKDKKVLLELAEGFGSLTKQPFTLSFKDHTYDLSAKVWPQKEPSKETIKPQQKQLDPQVLNTQYTQKKDLKPKSYSFKNNNPQPSRGNPRYVDKVECRTSQGSNNITRLRDITSKCANRRITILVVVSNLKTIEKSINGRWLEFQECALADPTGQVIGSFYSSSKLEERQCYEFNEMKVKINNNDSIEIQETKQTTFRVRDQSFKPKYNQLYAY